MTLRWRIAAVMAALCTLVAVLAAVGAYVSTSNQLATQLDHDLTTRAVAVGQGPGTDADSDGDGNSVADDTGCPPVAVFGPVDAAQLVQTDGVVVVCISSAPPLPPAVATGPAGTAALATSTVGGITYRIATSQFHGGGSIQVALSTAPNDDVLAALRRRLLLIALASTLLGGLAGWLLATRLVAPVERVRRAARAIASTQDLTIPVPSDGPVELRDLGQDIATMVAALAASRDQQHRLVTDASHELRTPLTSLSANLELLERFDELPESERPDVIHALRADADDLVHLARDLVELATDRSADEHPVDTTLIELVRPVVARARRRSGRDIQIEDHTDPTLDRIVSVKPQMIQRAASNLLDNALKYAPNRPVVVRVDTNTIEVLDRGPGIDPADASHMFERFWRSDTARGLPGSGLGLSIVAQIAAQHHGNAWARSRPDGGTAVGLQINNDTDTQVPERRA